MYDACQKMYRKFGKIFGKQLLFQKLVHLSKVWRALVHLTETFNVTICTFSLVDSKPWSALIRTATKSSSSSSDRASICCGA